MNPLDTGEKPIFKWDTLREIGQDTLSYEAKAISGKVYEVELTTGPKVRAWKSDDGPQYFCHGLTFGSKTAPSGAVSPYGQEVPAILAGHYQPVRESEATPDDILVFRGADANEVVHSAVLIVPVVMPGRNFLDYSSKLRSKNGNRPEATLDLEAIILEYGEAYNVYRRR